MGDDAPELSSQEVVDAINKGQRLAAPRETLDFDPVDGTLGFVRGDQYAIALALMEEGDLKVGVMGCPNMPKQGDVLEFASSYSYGFSPRLFKMLAGILSVGIKGASSPRFAVTARTCSPPMRL